MHLFFLLFGWGVIGISSFIKTLGIPFLFSILNVVACVLFITGLICLIIDRVKFYTELWRKK